MRLDDATGASFFKARWGIDLGEGNFACIRLDDATIYQAWESYDWRILKPINDGKIFEPK